MFVNFIGEERERGGDRASRYRDLQSDFRTVPSSSTNCGRQRKEEEKATKGCTITFYNPRANYVRISVSVCPLVFFEEALTSSSFPSLPFLNVETEGRLPAS